MQLTPEIRARRIAVAQDILLQLAREDNPLKPATGSYIRGNMVAPQDYCETQLQAVVEDVQQNCRVCAMGAILLSYARLYNEVKLKQISFTSLGFALMDTSGFEIINRLRGTFDAGTLRRIEATFEHDRRYFEGWDAKRILQEIAETIIKNDGEYHAPLA